jgi:beta-phosphoglucomutase-like phosphatase (HAD superfamily)
MQTKGLPLQSLTLFDAILFDMDGTLVDTEPLWLICERELMSRFGYDWTPTDQANCLGGPLDRVGEYMHLLAGRAESGPYFTQTLISLMVEKLHSGAELTEGASELMAMCVSLGIPMALVSASPRIIVDAVLENLSPHEFSISVSSDDVQFSKPNPEGYLQAADYLQVSISRCLILEDSKTGVAAAEASGACVIAIPHLVEIAETSRVKIISSLKELNLEKMRALFSDWSG